MTKYSHFLLRLSLITLFAAMAACPLPALATAAESAEKLRIAAVLDDWHDAASKADFARYFSHFSGNAVFLGTDGSERWTAEEFRAYAKPHFDKGQGWTYVPKDRHISISADGQTAWFDEKADSAKYGRCRGSGVLVHVQDGWKITQYNLSVPIPNDLLLQVVGMIDAGNKSQRIEDIDVRAAAELAAKHRDNKNFIILDVRTPEEYASGHLASSQNIDYNAPGFKDKLATLDRTKTYLVHCAKGYRSSHASEVMKELGFREVYNMTGGMSAWTAAGLPVAR